VTGQEGSRRRGYDAFLLVSFGGPEGPDDVMPFLENVTRGRRIPRERLEAVAHHYLALDGVSPINAQNRALLAALRAELGRRAIDLPAYWGNRNWAPFLGPTLAQLRADGHRRVLAFTTSAYSSYSSCRQYREDLAGALAEVDLADQLQVDLVRRYFDHPGFVRPFADGLAVAIEQLITDGHDASGIRVLFTTHSIPMTMAATSGPPGRFGPDGAYVVQHRAAIDAVLGDVAGRGIPVPAWSLVYQSRSGSPHVPWLEPDINDAVRDAAATGTSAVVIVPIGFVSDHVEVVWDLDHEALETCNELGLTMVRIPTPGTHPAFVAGIVDLVEERLGRRSPEALSPLGPWASVCPADCCANPAGVRLTVAGAD
jgi:ferrochelatase